MSTSHSHGPGGQEPWSVWPPQGEPRLWLGGLTGLRALALSLGWVTGFWPLQHVCQLGWFTARVEQRVCQKQGDLFLLQPQANGRKKRLN